MLSTMLSTMSSTMSSAGLILDKRYPECCSIAIDWHVAETLGVPIKLPPALECLCEKHWANTEEVEPNLLALFELMTGSTYEQVARDNTFNHENSLDGYFVYTVYAPVGCNDWVWTRDVFVVIEQGAGGDPRYSAYSTAQIYHLSDGTVADSGFFDTTLSWWLEPISDLYDPKAIDWLNDRISCGYSTAPYYELTTHTYGAPIWNDARKCYLVRPKNCPYVCRAMPLEPCHG